MTLVSKFSAAGYRLSSPRRQVYRVLESASVPLTPTVVHRELITEGRSVGLTSVYRSLNLLVALELAKIVLQPDGSTGFVLAKEGHYHTLVCQNCHKIYEFSSCTDLTSLIAKVQAETQFLIKDHLLQLFGLCPECQRQGIVNG